MRHSYTAELSALSRTYNWCLRADIQTLAQQIDACASRGLVAVGSGGSFSAAYFAADLHQTYTNHLSRALTPLHAVAVAPSLGATNVLLLSARGKNADIVGAARVLAEAEPRHLLAITMREESPLANMLAEYDYTHHVSFAPPEQRDGFLATNSLLAFLLLVYRSYCANFSGSDDMPQSYEELQSELQVEGSPLSLKGRTVLTLYGADTAAGAYDFESKMSEAALGSVLLSDYRNFAHGRHFWLARRPESSAVVAFYSDADAELAATTLAMLPAAVPVVRVGTGTSGPLANIRSVIAAMSVVGDLAELSGVNLSRPGVPDFGRRIFHASAFKRTARSRSDVAVHRKLITDAPRARLSANEWHQHYSQFVDTAQTVSIAAVVADYDGTLCSTAERYTGVAELADKMEALLAAGLAFGIATGRGDSVACDLRKRFSKRLWPRVIVGHYNGGMIRRLDEEIDLDSLPPDPNLAEVAANLREDGLLQNMATIRERPRQLTIRANRLADVPATWARVSNVAFRNPSVAVVTSSHSLDVIPRTQSKLGVVEAIRAKTGADLNEILCVGDKGAWPGNDYELLQLPLSLSVDEVSPSVATCWNISPPGYRGPQATGLLFDSLKKKPRSTIFRLRLKHES